MTEATSRNLRRNLPFLRARDDARAELGEECRDELLTQVETLIAETRVTNPALAREMEQQAKLFKIRNTADFWIRRRRWSPRALLEKP